MAIIPAAVFIALSLPRVAYLARKPRIVGAKTFQTIKLVGHGGRGGQISSEAWF